MISDLLVNLSTNQSSDVARDYAVSMLSLFDAHLSAVAVAREFAGWAASGPMGATMIDKWSAERRAEAEKAVEAFNEYVRPRTVRSDARVISDRLGDPFRLFSEIARNYDMCVIGQSQDNDEEDENSLLIEAALFNSGRPVLVVPYIQKAGMKLDRVLVCWDGSQHAARAIADAMPLLKRARRVDVITVDQKERPAELKGAAIADHLARHRMKVELKAIIAPDTDAANVILNEVSDSGVDLIVMGAYGHTRFREFVIGGVTRSMLSAMTAPVLMSH